MKNTIREGSTVYHDVYGRGKVIYLTEYDADVVFDNTDFKRVIKISEIIDHEEHRNIENRESVAISEFEFVKRAIINLRKPPYNGIHSVYSGFNEAFREYFHKDPVEATTILSDQKLIEVQIVKGGAMLYLPDNKPYSKEKQNRKDVLKIILNEDN